MSVWPTPAQDLLLRAALLPDERAGAAWRRARPDIDVATLDAEAAMVLPLVRHNLAARGVEDDLFGLFKGVQRHTWARTQLLLAPLMPVVAALEAAGIPTLLLKGGALVADARLTAGLRPMNDLDVLVPTGQRADAVAVLADQGLVPFDGLADWHVVERVPEHSPSYPFVDAHDRELDLHWHVLHDSCQTGADDDFWAAAVPIELLGVRTRALCPTDELLLVLLHGMRWSPSPPLRWALDAGLLASGALGPIDYDRLVGQAQRRRLGAAVGAALAYIVRTADVPVPDGVLRSLRRRTPAERLAVRARATRPGERGRLLRAVVHHEQHLARTLPLGRRATAAARLRAERDRRRGRLVVDGAATVGPRAAAPIALG